MRIKDILEGASNFEAWKLRMLMILKKQKLTTVVENAPKSKKTDEWEFGNIKAMEILVDGVRDHLLHIITKLDSAYEMFKALEVMFQINNTSRILTLKNQLNNIKMKKGETITSYCMRIMDLRNQLLMVGHTYDNKELVMVSLNGIPLSWENFTQGIGACLELPKFDQLQAHYIQEECNKKNKRT